jgi:hypothetical protein
MEFSIHIKYNHRSIWTLISQVVAGMIGVSNAYAKLSCAARIDTVKRGQTTFSEYFLNVVCPHLSPFIQ